MNGKRWMIFAIGTTLAWGIWGALIEIPEKAGFPATLGYVIWALTMIPPAIFALKSVGWQLQKEFRSVLLGSAVGLLGAGGQLLLFQALRIGPAYLVFPIISLSPVITILLSSWLLGETTGKRGWIGIVVALLAIALFSYQQPRESAGGLLWLMLALAVFVAWGLQAYVIKFANESMTAESIFFYMMATSLVLAPVAIAMTDFSQTINWSWRGPWLTAAIQILNSVGALLLVYAFRYGKAIVVSPLTNAVAPMITVLLSLAIYRVMPGGVTLIAMLLALLSTTLLAVEEEDAEAVEGNAEDSIAREPSLTEPTL